MDITQLVLTARHKSGLPASSLPCIALAFLLGVCVLQLQPDLYLPVWTQSELVMLLPLLGFVFYLRPGRRCILAFFLGYLWALLFAHSYLQQRLDSDWEDRELLIRGEIVGLLDRDENASRFKFMVSSYPSATSSIRYSAPLKLKLSWYHNSQILSTGDKWQLLVKLKVPHGFHNPNGFDYEKWLYQKGLHATGYVRNSASNQRAPDNAMLSVDALRQHVQQVIAALPNNSNIGLLQALTIGHKALISSQQWQVLVKSGTSHLLAISGLHIGLVSGLVFFVTRRLVPVSFLGVLSAQQYAAIVSICSAALYTALAGFSIPTQRAFIMLLVIMLAILLKRPAFSLNTLSLALLAVLIHDPISVLSVGFWLSFIAVLLISLIVATRGYTSTAWIQGVRVQWIIALAMLPLTLLLFNQGTLISPIANMLMIPLVGLLIVPLSLVASLLSTFSLTASVWLFSLASHLLSVGWAITEWLAGLPYASWQQADVPLLQAALALCGGVLLLLPKGFPLKFSGIILLLPMLLYEADRPVGDDVWISVLDVGQGLSMVIRTQDKTLLYDAGAKVGERFDVGSQVVAPYLRSVGVSQLDTLVISHVDNDHAGGAGAVIRQLSVAQFMVGSRGISDGLPYGTTETPCKAGDSWRWNGVLFEVLHPKTLFSKTNNQSCVLRVSNSHASVLLSGDIESKVEHLLVEKNRKQLAADVLIAPHHGSNTSSSTEFLKAVSPRLVIVSSGYKNRFRHPARKVVNRYAEMGVELLNTAYDGAIQLKFSQIVANAPIRPNRQRKDTVHYWNHRF